MTDDPKPMLARLKAEYAAATPGEWHVQSASSRSSHLWAGGYSIIMGTEDAVLTADTHNCLPALLALGDDAIRFREALEEAIRWAEEDSAYWRQVIGPFTGEVFAARAAKLRAVLARKGSEGEG
jgi:hypothetical protein